MMTHCGLLGIKLAAILSYCGGPLILSDILKPRFGMAVAFTITFAPIALMTFGALSMWGRSMSRWERLTVILGLVGGFVLAFLHGYGAWRLIVEPLHPDRTMYVLGISIGIGSVVAYMYAATLRLRRCRAEPRAPKMPSLQRTRWARRRTRYRSPAMKPPSAEVERRRPVWEALSEFFLDTELQWYNYEHIARVLAASGYSDEELESILRREVGPVLGVNLLSVAGEWACFDSEWLSSEILKRERSWRRWLPCYTGYGMVRAEWERVRRLLGRYRVEEPCAPADRRPPATAGGPDTQ